jgi:hypothetical protein
MGLRQSSSESRIARSANRTNAASDGLPNHICDLLILYYMIYRLSIYYYRYSLSSLRRVHAPSRWVSELALSVGKFQKCADKTHCAVAVNPCPADAHHAAPSPASTPNKACSGWRGFVAVFERFLASSFFCRPSWFSPAATNPHRWAIASYSRTYSILLRANCTDIFWT